MKKLIIAAILMIATGGILSAQNTKPGNGTPGTNKSRSGFVDANKNGICDTYESSARSGVNGKGQRMNKGQGAGYGRCNGQCDSSSTKSGKAGTKGCKRAV